MKGSIKKGSMRAFAFAAACLISVSDAGYLGSANVCTAVSATGQYKTWKQGDRRWGDLHLGKSQYTMSSSGCAATSVAMLLVHAGNFNESNFDPGIFCRLMNQFGGFGPEGDIYWSVTSKIAPGFVFETTDYLKEDLTYEQKVAVIKKYLDQGYYMVIDVNPHHWVAVDGMVNGRVYSMDPAGGKGSDVFKEYNYKETTCIKLFKSKGTSAAPPPVKNISTSAAPVTTAAVTTSKTVTTTKAVTTAPAVTQAPVSSSPITAQSETAAKIYRTGAYKTNDYLNYREKPDVKSEKYGVIPPGTNINVYEVSSNWGRTEYGGKKCWVCLDYADFISGTYINADMPVTTAKPVTTTAKVTTASPVTTTAKVTTASPATTTVKTTTAAPVTTTVKVTTAASAVTSPQTITVVPLTTAAVTTASSESVTESEKYLLRCRTTSALNFRTGAGTSNDIMCVIPVDTDLIVYEVDCNDRWGKVKYMDRTGWVCLDYVALIEEETRPSEEASVTEISEEIILPDTSLPETIVTEAQTSSVLIGAAEESAVITQSGTGVFRGDVDRNGFINVLDYVKLKSFFEGEYKVSEEADVNDDGVVNICDLIALRKLFIKII